jgi:hypothetical protein
MEYQLPEWLEFAKELPGYMKFVCALVLFVTAGYFLAKLKRR